MNKHKKNTITAIILTIVLSLINTVREIIGQIVFSNDILDLKKVFSSSGFLIFAFVLSIEIIILAVITYKDNDPVKDTTTKSNDENSIEKSLPFKYLDYNEESIIYPNGHVIGIYSYRIKILNKEEIKFIYKKFDLTQDVGDIFKYPPLEEMLKKSMDLRFQDFGFWYKQKNDFISGIAEFYWDDNDLLIENMSDKENPKLLKWIFEIDKSQIENGQDYEFSYIISIPGMLPITDGKHDEIKKAKTFIGYWNSVNLDSNVDNYSNILSFEKNVKVKNTSIACSLSTNRYNDKKLDTLICKDSSLMSDYINIDDYNRYITTAKDLKVGSTIKYFYKMN